MHLSSSSTAAAAASDSAAASSSSSSSSKSSAAARTLSPSSPLSLAAGSSFTLSVSLHRRNSNPNVRIFTPVFSKPKDEAWWVLVGLSSTPALPGPNAPPAPTDELVAIKRVNNLKQRTSINLKVQLPPGVAAVFAYTVYLVSDSYIGFDQQISFRVDATGHPSAAAAGGRNNQSASVTATPAVAASSAVSAAAAAAADPDDIYN